MTVFGWDASDNDWARGPMDLHAARAAGIDFFTHKATEGTRTVHQHYGDALGRARDAGIPYLGAYVVPRTPGNNGHGSVAAQASYFLDYVNRLTPWWREHPGFFIQVDLEHWEPYDSVAPAIGVELATTLRNLTGRRILLYAPKWSYGNTIPGSDPLWASDYGANVVATFTDVYARRGGDGAAVWSAAYSGRAPTIWQFGSKTQIGRQPSCDADAFRGTLADFHKLITGKDMTLMAVTGAPDQLLNGWTQPTNDDGSLDARGVGIWVADSHAYVWRGSGCYDKPNDPAGPANGLYLDKLLKLIRDHAASADQGVAALAALKMPAAQPAAAPADIPVDVIVQALAAALPAALKTALEGMTFHAAA